MNGISPSRVETILFAIACSLTFALCFSVNKSCEASLQLLWPLLLCYDVVLVACLKVLVHLQSK
jgi:hypothetical protein